MIQKTAPREQPDFSGGLNTNPNLLALQPNQTPSCVNVRFPVGAMVEKRAGTQTVNSVVIVSNTASGFQPDSSGTLAVALTAFWNLDEQSGTRFDAFDGQHLLDFPVGFTSFTGGLIGNAVVGSANEFGVNRADPSMNPFGEHNYLYLNSARAFITNSGSFTVSGWMNRRGDRPRSASAFVSLGHHDNPLLKNAMWALELNPADNTPSFILHSSSKPFGVDAGAKLGSSLVAYWKFDEESGTRRDAVGLNHLTLSNANSADEASLAVQYRSLRFVRSGTSGALATADDNADLSTGDIDFAVAGWIYFATKPSDVMGIVRKGRPSTLEWRLYYHDTLDRIVFEISSDGTASAAALASVSSNALGSPNTGQWYFLRAQHDSTNDRLTLQVNNLTVDTIGTAGKTPRDLSGDLTWGRFGGTNDGHLDAYVDEWGWWKRTLSASEHTDLWNSGSGQTYLSAGSVRIVKAPLAQALRDGSWDMVTASYNSATSTMSLQVNTITATTALNIAFPYASTQSSSVQLLARVLQDGFGRFSVDAGGTLTRKLLGYWKLGDSYELNVASTYTLINSAVMWMEEEVFGDFGLSVRTDAAILAGTPVFAVGRVGSALEFSRANSSYLETYFTQPHQSQGVGIWNQDYTVSCWAFLTTNNASMTLVSKGSGTTTREFVLQYSGGLDRFTFSAYGSGGTLLATAVATTLGAPATSTWYLLTGVHNAAADYVGLQVDTFTMVDTALTNGSAPQLIVDTTSRVNVGRLGDGTNYFAGRLDELGLWGRQLAATEVQDLYNGSSGNTYSNLANDDTVDAWMDQWGFWTKALSSTEVADLYNGTSGNSYDERNSFSGWGSFDFGAGFANAAKTQPLRQLVVAAATGIYASSNRGVSWLQITTGRGADYQEFERSKIYLIACSNSGDAVLYWAGSVGTNMSRLAPGSAPAAKHALDFQGFLLLMNDTGGTRRISYADNTKILTDPWTNTFELPSSYDDEITAGTILNKKAYVSTKYKIFRVSHVGGAPDFAYQDVKEWGYVPRTVKKVTLPEIGEVIIGLSWDKKVKIFDGSEDRIVSDTIEFSNGLSSFYISNLREEELLRCHAEVDTNLQEYNLWCVMSPSSRVTHRAVLNLRTMVWYAYDRQHFGTAVMAESGNTRVLTAIGTDGFCHYLNTANTDAGQGIDAMYESPFIFGRTPKQLSKGQKMDLYFSATSSGTLYVEDHLDYGRTYKLRDTVVLTRGNGSTIVTKTIDTPVTENVYQYRISDSASKAEPWRLLRVDGHGANLGYGGA